MDKLYQRLQEIKQRPGLYLGEKTLVRLEKFLSGYALCREDYGIEKTKLFDGFDDFVRERYGIKTHNAMQIINFYSGTKEEAFYKYFELLEKYWAMHPENLE